MRSLVVGVVAAALGALGFWTVDRWTTADEGALGVGAGGGTVREETGGAGMGLPVLGSTGTGGGPQLVGVANGASSSRTVQEPVTLADGPVSGEPPPPAAPRSLPALRSLPKLNPQPVTGRTVGVGGHGSVSGGRDSGSGVGLAPVVGSTDSGRLSPGAAAESLGGAPSGVEPYADRSGLAGLDAQRRRALEVYEGGDLGRGLRLLQGVYIRAKHRPGVDLSLEVERLLQDEMTLVKRLEYVEYLKRRGRIGLLFERRWQQAMLGLANVEEAQPSVALSVWEDLSLAYELAEVPAQRAQVMAHLAPFLDRLVFSRRYSPLLNTYTVQPGDNLSRIAEQFSTTVDAIRRLNGLKANVIQPRMRLRLLEGEVKIFVDKSDFRIWVTVGGRLLLERLVGLGRDNGTPIGDFEILVRQRDPSWWKPGQPAIPAGDPRNVLGTRWLGFRDTPELAGFGIHGTADASSVGSESSAGCIRLQNEDVELLYDFVPIGTSVSVRP